MQAQHITYDGIFGPAWGANGGAGGLVSEFGSGPPSPAPMVSAATATMLPFIGRDFFRSSDFGLLVLGALVVYFDLRIINRKRG